MILYATFDIVSIEYNHNIIMHRWIKLCSDIFSRIGEIIYVYQQMQTNYKKLPIVSISETSQLFQWYIIYSTIVSHYL